MGVCSVQPHRTCGLEVPCNWLNVLLLLSTVLLICEQVLPHFYFSLSTANYVVSLGWINEQVPQGLCTCYFLCPKGPAPSSPKMPTRTLFSQGPGNLSGLL